MSDEYCLTCGYTKADAEYWGDHGRCKNAGNAPWEKPSAPTVPEVHPTSPEREWLDQHPEFKFMLRNADADALNILAVYRRHVLADAIEKLRAIPIDNNVIPKKVVTVDDCVSVLRDMGE